MTIAEGTSTSKSKLTGTDEATIDEKGRILIPRKKRDRLGESVVIRFTEFECIALYPAQVWDQLADKIIELDRTNSGDGEYTRLMLGNAEEDIVFDSQGRFVIPQKMRTDARLKKNVILVGCGDRLEVWAKEEYEEYLNHSKTYRLERRQLFASALDAIKGA